MGVRKSEAGSRVEAPQKRPTPPLIIFLLLHFSTPDFWLLGCAPRHFVNKRLSAG